MALDCPNISSRLSHNSFQIPTVAKAGYRGLNMRFTDAESLYIY